MLDSERRGDIRGKLRRECYLVVPRLDWAGRHYETGGGRSDLRSKKLWNRDHACIVADTTGRKHWKVSIGDEL